VRGHDVRPAVAAVDRADVGGRLLVDAAEAHRGDRVGGRDDRAAPVLRSDAGVRGATAEVRLEPVVGRRGDDDLADRARVVEDVAERRAQRRRVERLGAGQRVLLADREQQLDADRQAVDHGAPRERQQDRHRGLVVGAQDGVACALPAVVHEHGLDDAVVRHGVEVGAEQHRAAGVAAGQAREEVARLRTRLGGRAVLGHLEPQRAQLAGDVVGDRALAPERAGDRAQRRERLVEPPALDLRGGPHSRASARGGPLGRVHRRLALGPLRARPLERGGDEVAEQRGGVLRP
jgi:hypothetical protein